MTRYTILAILASVTMGIAGCSKHAASTPPKSFDLGDVDISGGKPTTHTLADGRVCTITTSPLGGGVINLTASISETNASGVQQLTRSVQVSPDSQTCTVGLGNDIVLTMTLHK